jgi:hypothetical protein
MYGMNNIKFIKIDVTEIGWKDMGRYSSGSE